jgi:hypothetical protein
VFGYRTRPTFRPVVTTAKPAGYQRVGGYSQHSVEVCGRRRKRQKVTRRVIQPLASMRFCGHKIGLLPTLLPTSAFWGWRGGVGGISGGLGDRLAAPAARCARSPAGLRSRALCVPRGRVCISPTAWSARGESRFALQSSYGRCRQWRQLGPPLTFGELMAVLQLKTGSTRASTGRVILTDTNSPCPAVHRWPAQRTTVSAGGS